MASFVDHDDNDGDSTKRTWGLSTPHCHNDPCGNKGNTACDGDNLVSIRVMPVRGFYPAGVSGVVRECFQQGSGVAAGSVVQGFIHR